MFIKVLMFFYLISDPSTRGIRKFSDKCDNTQDCGFQGSFCDPNTKVCQCNPDVPATNHIDKCGRGELFR